MPAAVTDIMRRVWLKATGAPRLSALIYQSTAQSMEQKVQGVKELQTRSTPFPIFLQCPLPMKVRMW